MGRHSNNSGTDTPRDQGDFQHSLSNIDDAVLDIVGSDKDERRKMLRALHVQRIWESVVSEDVLKHTDNVFVFENEKLGGKEMVVYVDSAIWAADLTARKISLKWKVETALGEGELVDLRFIPSSGTYERKTFTKHRDQEKDEEVVPSISLTAEEREMVFREASVIENQELRQTLINARIKDMEWKKGIEASKRR